jgi:hypothetical protein
MNPGRRREKEKAPPAPFRGSGAAPGVFFLFCSFSLLFFLSPLPGGRKQILFSSSLYRFSHYKGKGGSYDQGRVAACKGEICGFRKRQGALVQAGIRRQAQAGLFMAGYKVRKGLLPLQIFSLKQDL